MATAIETLFNIKTPEQVRQSQRMQDLAQGELLTARPGTAGLLFAPQRSRAIGQGIAGLFGAETRSQAEIDAEENRKLLTGIYQRAQQAHPTDRTAQLNMIATELANAGRIDEAQKARAMAQQSAQAAQATATSRAQELRALAEKEKAERASPLTDLIGKLNPQDYTPESIEAFQTSGKYSDLKRVEKPEDDNRTTQQKNFETYQNLLASGNKEQARKFGVSAGFIPEMSVKLQGEHIDAMNLVQSSQANAMRYNDLANDVLAAEEFKGGTYASWEEAYKEFTGNTDAVSALKTRYRGIRASSAMDNLPPGAASDADVRLALSGVPPESANATTVAQFLRGLAKLEAEVAAYNAAKVAYLDANRELIGFEDAYKRSRERVENTVKGTTRTTATGTTYEVLD